MMKLGMQVGLGPGHIVLHRDPAPPPPNGGRAPIFHPYLLWPNGWMDEDATWQGDRPQPKQHCVRWGPSSPSPKGGGARQVLADVYCDQTAGWMKMSLGTEIDLSPGHIVLNGDSAPSCERGTAASRLFTAHVCCDHGRPSHLLLSSFPVRSPHQQHHQVHMVLGRLVIFNQYLPVSHKLNEMGT